MPPIAIAIGAYLLGLLVGPISPLPMLVVGLVGAASAIVAHRPSVAALCGIACAGIVIARATTASDVRCMHDAMLRRPLRAQLGGNAAPGTFVHATPVGCATDFGMFVVSGEATAGTTVSVTGTADSTRRGVVVQRATIEPRGRAPVLARIRGAAGAAIDRVFDDDAPLARAMLIADKSELSPNLRDRFAGAGLAHLLAVAGLHIGLLVLGLEFVLGLCGVPRMPASIAALAAIAVFVAAIGAPPSAVRAAAMLAVRTASRVMQRPASPWAALAVGASEPVFDPHVATALGFQLSVACVAAVIAAACLVRRMSLRTLPSRVQAVVGSLVVTTIATIASAPLLAWSLGRVSLIAPLSNVVAAPLFALAQPTLFCAFVLTPLPSFARFFADAAHPLLHGLDAIAAAAVSIPGSVAHVQPTAGDALLSALAAGAIVSACASRNFGRPAACAAAALSLLVWEPFVPMSASMTEVHALDVGRGESIALRTPRGRWVLINAGAATGAGDAGKSVVVPYLAGLGGQLEGLVLSDCRTDHAGGTASVIRARPPRLYLAAAAAEPSLGSGACNAAWSTAAAAGIPRKGLAAGDSLLIDDVRLDFIAPPSPADPDAARGAAPPELAVLVTVGDVRIVLAGDLEADAQESMLRNLPRDLHADAIFATEHGAANSSPRFLEDLRPRVAIISGMRRGRPPTDDVALRRLAGAGAQVLRPAQLGTIVMRTDGRRLIVEAAGDEWVVPAP